MARCSLGLWLLFAACVESNPSYVPPEDTSGGSTTPGTTTPLTSTQGPSSSTTTAEPTTTSDPTTVGSVSASGPQPVCGDGVVDPTEECDDADMDDGDECTSACKNATCGDGFLHVGKEACDDGNLLDEDDCTAKCEDPVCGDGIVHKGKEECDDGNMVDVDGCSNACVSQLCSNGKLDLGEADVDCGGNCLEKCGDGKACGVPADCESSFCEAGACKIAPTCKKIHAGDPMAQTGVYLLDPDGGGPKPPFKAFCEMETAGGGWTMVFKLSAGLLGDPLPMWKDGPLNELDEALLHPGPSPKPYRSAIVDDYWGGDLVQEAGVVVYKNGTPAVFMRFGTFGLDKLAWFGLPSLLDPWFVDLMTEPVQLLSIVGENAASRRFYLNRNYGGCPADAGWLFVDSEPDSCTYESNSGVWKGIRILYTPNKKFTTWEPAVMNGTVGFGDTFVVYVR